MKENRTIRTVVTVIVAVTLAIVCFLGGFLTCKFTRKRQVSSFEWALETVRKNYYEDIPSDTVLNASLKGFAALCLDRYSAYYTAEEYSALIAQNSGSMSGVGISYMYVPAGAYPQGKSGALVESVVGNSPAFESGLKRGEFITALADGKGRVEITSADALGDFIDAKATGEPFTIITDVGEYPVAKAEYTASYCTMSTSSYDWNITYEYNADTRKSEMRVDKSKGGISCLPQGAAYLRLDQFFGNVAEETAALIEEYNAENCTSLILDLRGNGGGYVDAMCDISDIFVGQLPDHNKIAMIAEYKDGKKEAYSVGKVFPSSKRFSAGAKLSVLADNGTASASEALIGVLIDNGVINYTDIYLSDFSGKYLEATDTGDKNCRTYGKGIMQTTFVNPSTREALKLTTAKIYWPKGEKSIHDVGLTTDDKCKTVKTDWDVVYGDPQLASAVEMIYAN